MVVCSSSIKTRLPSCTAKINVPNSITISVNRPCQPTPATCAKVILNPNKITPALSNILLAKSTPASVRVAISENALLPTIMPSTIPIVKELNCALCIIGNLLNATDAPANTTTNSIPNHQRVSPYCLVLIPRG